MSTTISAEMIAILLMGIAIIGVQVTVAIYMLRRLDSMQMEINELRKDIGKVSERVARLEGILIGRLEVSNGTFTRMGDE